jgi:plastocyanin
MLHRRTLSLSSPFVALLSTLVLAQLSACAHSGPPPAPALDAQGRFLRDTLIIDSPSHALYAGTTVQVTGHVWRRGAATPDTSARIHWSVREVRNGWVAENGTLVLLDRGTVTLIAESGVLQSAVELEIAENPIESVVLEPSSITTVSAGDTVAFMARLTSGTKDDANARVHYAVATRGLGPNAGASIDSQGRFVARSPGIYTVIAAVGTRASRAIVEVQGSAPRGSIGPLDDLEIADLGFQPYVGTYGVLRAVGREALRDEKQQVEGVRWRSSDATVARVASNGTVAFVGEGRVKITAEAAGKVAERTLVVRRDAAAHMAFRLGDHDIHVGDEVHLSERIWQRGGTPIRDARVNYAVVTHSLPWRPDAVEINEDGVFIARRPGVYTILAELGGVADQTTIAVRRSKAVARVGQ